MSVSSEVRIGIVGSGFMGHTYARTVTKMLRGARLTAVAGGSRAQALAEEYGVPCFASPEALAASKEVDAVLIGTPHAQHAANALAAIGQGKHVLIDKPMATSVADCDAILEACRQHRVKCSVTFTQRNRVGFAKAKELLDSGRLGKVVEIRSFQIVPNGMNVVPKWQMLEENVGLLLGHGVHNIDAIRVLTGQEVHAVFAKSRTMTGAPVEGTSDVLLTMADGGVHYIFCSFELSKPGFPRSESGARIACERGLIDLDAYKETRVSIEGGPWEVLAVQPPIDWAGEGYLSPNRLQTYKEVCQDFVDAILEDREPIITGWDGRQAVAAALAAYESSRTGKEIQLA